MVVSWLPPYEVERITRVRTWLQESVERDEALLSQPGLSDKRLQDLYAYKMDNAQDAAVFTWLADEDVEKCRQYFRTSAEAGIELLKTKDVYVQARIKLLNEQALESLEEGKIDPTKTELDEELMAEARATAERLHGEIVDTPTGKEIVYQDHSAASEGSAIKAMESALASGDMDLARKVADYPRGSEDSKWSPLVAYCYAGVLRYGILGDDMQVLENIKGLGQLKQRYPRRQLGACFAALLAGDEKAVKKELKAYLNWFRRNTKPKTQFKYTDTKGWHYQTTIPNDFLLSVAGIAFCNFAASRGMKLEFDEPFLPRQLLVY